MHRISAGGISFHIWMVLGSDVLMMGSYCPTTNTLYRIRFFEKIQKPLCSTKCIYGHMRLTVVRIPTVCQQLKCNKKWQCCVISALFCYCLLDHSRLVRYLLSKNISRTAEHSPCEPLFFYSNDYISKAWLLWSFVSLSLNVNCL